MKFRGAEIKKMWNLKDVSNSWKPLGGQKIRTLEANDNNSCRLTKRQHVTRRLH